MKNVIIVAILGLLFGCHPQDNTTVEYEGNRKTITEVRSDQFKFVVHTEIYEKCEILNIRIDDDSEYHVTYKHNGVIKSKHDLSDSYVWIKDRVGQSWVKVSKGGTFLLFDIYYPSSKIEYFDD